MDDNEGTRDKQALGAVPSGERPWEVADRTCNKLLGVEVGESSREGSALTPAATVEEDVLA